jgi:RimJ/RimL family protein N-acetyltransferase
VGFFVAAKESVMVATEPRTSWKEIKPLHGRLVRLRALEPEDAPKLYEWFNDPEVTATLGGPGYPKSMAFERDFVEKNQEPGYQKSNFGIVALDDGELIGTISFRNTSPENRSTNLGLAIGDKSRWRRGYGTDAMRVICRFGFEQMNLHRIELNVFASNEAARRVYEKVGFRDEGTCRQRTFHNAEYVDEMVMSVLEGELVLEDS